jgi:hypothetical protein
MSNVDPRGLTASDIWNYPTRDLTRTKFPFWSAIINQTQGSVTIAASTTTYVNIQPPAGETWLVWIDTLYDYPAYQVYYDDYDGITRRRHTGQYTGGGYGDIRPHLHVMKILTNALYGSLEFYNGATSAYTGYYGYSGFKLSMPLWSPKRLNDPVPAFKRPTQFPIPANVSQLAKYIVDIFVDGKYQQAIVLEEDTPLAVDEKGNVIESLSVYARVEDFIKNLTALKADPVGLGWKKYFDKWASEGITI